MQEDVRIRMAEGRADFDACVELQRIVWGLPDLEIIPALQFIAAQHAGGMVHLAETTPGGRIIGFGYAFPALHSGHSFMHSDMVAVVPDYQKRGVGIRIKWAQREAALARGIDLITWTFDPMQSRNAHLNLRRLGAISREFLENFYGVTSSLLHHGMPTHRLLVRWELNSARVQERAANTPLPAQTAAPELPRVNEVKWQGGWPISSDPVLDLDAAQVLLEIPPEWDVLSRAAPKVAESWQARIAAALKAYLGRGYVASNFIPVEELGRRRPFYVLSK
jgi:predicted GNAT superfamily acetyltransferase